MRRIVRRLFEDTYAAVAPTVAVTLFALVAAGGVAFDYARVAALDSELQNAADQAALAAASQLDGQSNACVRAAAAANALLENHTFMANEPGTGQSMNVAIPTSGVTDCTGNANIAFYQSYDQAADTFGAAATGNPNARVVWVKVTPREAFFTLTPIVSAFRSGNIGAEAIASLGSAVCRVPPLMMCNPNETGDPDFTVANYIGKGLKLVQGGSGSWAPGNFGFLDHAGGSNGDTGLREDLGWNVPPGECQPGDGVDTKPGVNAVNDAINTRFDIDGPTACVGSGTCPPSVNVVKDLLRDPATTGGNACRIHNQGWQEPASGTYLPSDPNNDLPSTTILTAMGHPRDLCHAVGSNGVSPCTGSGTDLRIGDGHWDRDAYFRTNYVRGDGSRWDATAWQTNTGLKPPGAGPPPVTLLSSNAATRWNVYNWEITHRGQTIDGVQVLGRRVASGALAAEGSPVCRGAGVAPSNTQVDRRKLVIAVANCSTADGGGQVNGNSTDVTVQKWIDSFLVEPSYARASGRTDAKQIYVEIIGETTVGGGAGPVIRRDVPYLIR